ncbi:maleylpyruvate isomerase family mycothiol-dependent enzyme [Kibdelosporangium persicum]|nr:maleylpyruvate isomerase family mycothiol-dependent enzyme [Kibdelosporangium persicum]
MAQKIAEVAAGHARLAEIVGTLTDDQARADSALPGWSRGHVLTHVANLARALTRQVEYALDGKLVDVYDGGAEGRAAAIEQGAGRPAAALADDVVQSAKELESAWAAVGPDDWARPVKHRDGTVADTVLVRWREVEIHTADLGLTPVRWSPEFRGHLFGFLSPRIPAGVSLVLPDRTLGEGEPVHVTGDLTDIAAWLAGRDYAGELVFSRPIRLGPWP